MNIIQGYPNPQKDYYKVYVRSFTFNQAPYIEDNLNGVAMQETNFPFVHHVIDDASTDGEQDVIKAWMDKNCVMEHAEYYDNDVCAITLVKNNHNPNCTLVACFLKKNLYKEEEKKMELCNPWREVCPYEAICEGDDYWIASMKLQKQVDYLDAHEDCSMCFHRAAKLYFINDPSPIKSLDVEDRDYNATELFKEWIVPTASIMHKAYVNDYKIKGSDRILHGDIFIVEKCAHTGKVHGMSDVMGVYRIQSAGITYDLAEQRKKLKKYPLHTECIRDNFNLIDKKVINERLFYEYLNRAYSQTKFAEKYSDMMVAFGCSPKLFIKRFVVSILGFIFKPLRFTKF